MNSDGSFTHIRIDWPDGHEILVTNEVAAQLRDWLIEVLGVDPVKGIDPPHLGSHPGFLYCVNRINRVEKCGAVQSVDNAREAYEKLAADVLNSAFDNPAEELSVSELRPRIEKLCDNIDAAVFSGDQFMEAPARARLRFFMARWEKELVSWDAIADPCPAIGVSDALKQAVWECTFCKNVFMQPGTYYCINCARCPHGVRSPHECREGCESQSGASGYTNP
jgi:hypothetical protein